MEKNRKELHGYAPVRRIGSGAFSQVYLVKNKKGEYFACKISRSGEASVHEAETLKAMSHPFSPEFFDFWQERESCLVMEYLEGSTLEEHLRRRHSFSADCVIRVGQELASGLSWLHEQHGLAYRDLKPSNIVITQNGRVKLIDFGCVCSLGEPTGTMAGTPGFAAPEQLDLEIRQRVSAAGDVYGLGKVMEAMLGSRRGTGKLRRVIAVCIAERQENRFPDMRSVGAALAECGKKRRKRNGWEEDILTGRISVQKNIWKSLYKKP